VSFGLSGQTEILALCGEEAREKQPIGLKCGQASDWVQHLIFRERPVFGAQATPPGIGGIRWLELDLLGDV
jgi:hypothetical protein